MLAYLFLNAAQYCTVNTVSSDNMELLVDRNAGSYCLQCVGTQMMSRHDIRYILPHDDGQFVTDSNTSALMSEAAHVMNGVLVLMEPSTLLSDGADSYSIQCSSNTSQPFRYEDIELYSSGKTQHLL